MSSPHILNVFAHNLNVKPQTLNAFRPPNLNVLTTLMWANLNRFKTLIAQTLNVLNP
jgi:hypothetical protein